VDGKLDIDTSVWWPDAFIPALQPYGLERVPGFRLKPGKKMPAGWRPTPGEQNPYEDTAWRAEHKDWRIELVDEVRPHIHKKGNGDQKFAAIERMLCAQDPNYFGAVYGHIFDPKAKADEPMRKPFAKFAYQCHNTSAMFEEIKKPHRSFLWRPKSRQLGISVDDEMFDTHFYLWGEGQAKLGSRNEKLVYNGRSYEAMFGKIIYNLQKLDEFTPYLLPAGYSAAKLLRRPWFRDMTLINPITGTALIGESTTKELARGGTYTFARLDESGFMENLADIITSVQEAALHIFLASTERANEYLEMWQAAKRELPKSIYEFNWHQNAYLDVVWEREAIAAAVSKKQKEGLNREAFRDPFAGFGIWAYPEARDLPDANYPYDPTVALDITIDPAGSGDEVAFMAAQATAFDGQEGFHVLFSYEREMPNVERIAHILTGIMPERGDSCFGWKPDKEEELLMQHFYNLWMEGVEVRWFMDPAGDQKHTKVSFRSMLVDKSKELREREYIRLVAQNIALEELGQPQLRIPTPKAISPKFKAIKQHRLFGDREYALRKYLPFITFQQGVLSAARVRECLGRTRYNDLAEAAITESKRRHDQYSHLASCCEYYAIYYSYRFIDPLDSKAMKKLKKKLGLPGVSAIPSGFKQGGIPSGFGKAGGLPRYAGQAEERPGPPGLAAMGRR
jgi:hypothetical protein